MSIILPERKEYLAGLLGLGGGSTGMAFGGGLPKSDASYIDNYFHTATRRKLNSSNVYWNRVDSGLKMASDGDGNSLQMNYTGFDRTNQNTQSSVNRNTSLSGISDSKAFTISAWCWCAQTQTFMSLFGIDSAGANYGQFEFGFGHYLSCAAWRVSSGAKFLDTNTSSYQPIRRGEWFNITISFDLSDTSKRKAYINDTPTTNWTWGTYTNENIYWSGSRIRIGTNAGGGSPFNGYIAHFFFDNTYTDLSVEANRRQFITADGVPTSSSTLEALSPKIYLPFVDQDTQFVNKGTGGDFVPAASDYFYTIGDYGPDKLNSDKVDGGMVWTKARANTFQHVISDTLMGGDWQLRPDQNISKRQNTAGTYYFDSKGYTIASGDGTNNAQGGYEYVDWSWARKPGFFDMIHYTGNGTSGRQIEHSLDCLPGLIIVKQISADGQDWTIYHGAHNVHTGCTRYGKLNTADEFSSAAYAWNNTYPSKTHFTLGNNSKVNQTSHNYVAYLFAHAPSRVESRGNGLKGLTVDPSDQPFSGSGTSDVNNGKWSVYGNANDNNGESNIKFYDMGTDDFTCPGEFTWEMWYKQNGSSYCYLFTIGDSGSHDGGKGIEAYFSGATLKIYRNNAELGGSWTQTDSNWHHFCMERDTSNTLKVYIDGTERYSFSNITGDVGGGVSSQSGFKLPIAIGAEIYNSQDTGRMSTRYSNCRLTKGERVYGGAFTPPTEPLTETSQGATASNVKLIALQGPRPTSITKGPVPKGSNNTEYSFGEDADQGVVNCGFYYGTGNGDGPNVSIGWQPQWLLIKNTQYSNTNWCMFDTARGINAVQKNDAKIIANDVNSEVNNQDWLELSAEGFKIRNNDDEVNRDGQVYAFVAIRAADAKVGKPPELGTDAFSIARGADSGASDWNTYCPLGTFQSHNFYSSSQGALPNGKQNTVDFSLHKNITSGDNWMITDRWRSTRYNVTNSNAASADNTNFAWDSQYGAHTGWDQNDIGYLWTRNAGADVVHYRGDYVGYSKRAIKHSLGQKPQLILIKRGDDTKQWQAYVEARGANYFFDDLANSAISSGATRFAGTEPTAEEFYIGSSENINFNNGDFVAYLFAGIDKISKFGTYTGNGSTTGPTITTGFKPRWVLTKSVGDSEAGNWGITDSQRGTNMRIWMGNNAAQSNIGTIMNFTDTGFQIKTTDAMFNTSGFTYMYYAHS